MPPKQRKIAIMGFRSVGEYHRIENEIIMIYSDAIVLPKINELMVSLYRSINCVYSSTTHR